MRFFKPLGALAALALIACCFLPWVYIASPNITVTGFDTTGTRFGKPGYLHLIFSGAFLALLFLKQVWVRRLNLFFMAFNVAWAFRNLLLMGACFAGECPEKRLALYLLPILSFVMLLAVLLAPDPVGDKNDEFDT
ncbi:hypothetical protein [Flaviaesturariibacter amylovorans]|uniref:DUF4293 family protein n=1 Tax=Flaviaesturariibacter amylovorans TaxID=1084520 RepID=A0ABP8GY34_9BACT